MRRVIVESPFAGRLFPSRDEELNEAYALAVCRALALRGDAPYASHLLLTRFLDDTIEVERNLGIEAGLVWGACAQRTVVAVDRGVSKGMLYGIERARAQKRKIEWFSLSEWRESWLPEGVDRWSWRIHSKVVGDHYTGAVR